MSTVLIIEDELDLAKVLRSYLENANMRVEISGRGDQGLALFDAVHPDLVILDLNLPGMDGLDITREIRKRGDTPIIMLTARVEETDRLIGLELGADDYVTKPFSPREVVARVRAVMRRAGQTLGGNSRKISVQGIEIDLEAHTVVLDGRPIELTPSEFNLLTTLAAQPGRVFSRMQLLEAMQGVSFEGYERTVDAHIKNLRSKLDIVPDHSAWIETVFGVGYRFRRE